MRPLETKLWANKYNLQKQKRIKKNQKSNGYQTRRSLDLVFVFLSFGAMEWKEDEFLVVDLGVRVFSFAAVSWGEEPQSLQIRVLLCSDIEGNVLSFI